MFRKFICLTVFMLAAGLLFCGQAAAETIYYDDFDGSAGVDVNGTTPDISATGTSWVAGADFDADGNIIWDGNDFGDSAYLPFEPVSGYIYTLSATIQASANSIPDNNWAAVGFTEFNTNPESRFYNDNGERNPVYWAMTRTNSTDANDQTFTGAGAAGGQDSDTASADQIMIVIDATQSTWVAEWYYNSALKRTENVSEALKDNFQYIAVSTNSCSAFIDEITLTRQIGPFAADPGPADEALGVPREPTLYWTPGDGADKHNVYFGTDFDDVNDADTGSGLLVSEEQDANSYGPLGTLEYNTTYYWRIDEVETGGSPVHKGQVWTFTTELEAGIVTLYYDNFDGSAGTDLDGTTPDITIDDNVWDAGATLNADGSFVSPPTFTAALPFPWQTGAVYELSATLNSHTGDFAAIAFMNDAPSVTTRINDNSPRLWMLVRGTDDSAADQAFIGPGTAGKLDDSSTSGALAMKVRIEMVSTTQWNVFWYFDGSLELQETVNPSTASIDLDYVSFGINGLFSPAIGDIASFKLVVIPQALNPNPADGELAYATDVQLQWQGGIYAVTHDVYLGTDFDDVNNADRDTPLGVLVSQDQSPTSYTAHSLTAGETYYWRIDGVRSDGFTIDKGPVWSFTVEPQHAYFPSPRDGAQYVTEDTDLYWTPGSEADTHDIYFGTDFDDVNDATRGTPLGVLLEEAWDSNDYDPGTLSIGETYYWRIDDVETGGSPIHKGPVWSFQTIPDIPVTDPHLLGWWSFDEGQGDLALDWSGHGNHGTLVAGPQWTEGRVNTALRFDGYFTYVDLPVGDELVTLNSCTVAAWVNFPGRGVNGQRIFDFGQDANDYMYLAAASGAPGSAMQFSIALGGTGQYQITGPVLSSGWHHVAVAINGDTQEMILFLDGAEVGFATTGLVPSDLGNTVNNFLATSQDQNGDLTGLLDEVQLYDYALTEEDLQNTLSFSKAWLPDPPDNATGVYRYPTLTWEQGKYVADVNGHELYFSGDFNDVNGRDPAVKTILTNPTYTVPTPPAPLESLGVYYWRVDEVNNAHPDVNWPGDIWTFTVRDEALIDDFEPYASSDIDPTESDDLRLVWIDGEWDYVYPPPLQEGHPGSSGGLVQLATDENDAWDRDLGGNYEHYQPAVTVRNGDNSMKFHFDNDGSVQWLYNLYSVSWHNDDLYIYDAPQYSEARAAVVDAGIIDAGEGQQSLKMANNWSGYKVMSISFYGDSNNTGMTSNDKLYVTLADDDVDDVNDQIQYNADVDSLSEEWWHDWYIPMSVFTTANGSLDMTNIYRIHVGVGNRVTKPGGGTGLIFIDDIQLYSTGICVAGSVTEDFTGDCEVDDADLDMMTSIWLNDVTTQPVIKIDASELDTGTITSPIANQGSYDCNFVDFDSADANTNPVVETVDGEQCITFDANQLLISDANAPDSITGTGPFTVVYKVYNPTYENDEEVFNWAKRGTDLRYASVCIGSSPDFGAAAFWGGVGDMGFNQLPDAGQWHEIIIVYEGRTDGTQYLWVDNHLDNSEAKSLDFWPDCPMMLGSAYDGDPYVDAIPDGLTPGYKFTGSLAYLAVYDYAVPVWELDDWSIGDAIPANPINLYDSDSVIDFKDLALMGLKWMEAPTLLGD